ncbi:MAG: hypothetical protein JNM70_22350, partial [Anaerolineae bacterium]|nr:hypothetical protein [Anaerolineae bacterium]
MATTEHTINDAIAALLRETRRAWRDSSIVRSENTGMLEGSHERPDILVQEPNVALVAIETELMPAVTVETEARERLGKRLRSTGSTILSAVAVRLPDRLRQEQGTGLREALKSAHDLEMALYTGKNQSDYSRWPRSGWLRGSIADLSVLAQSAAVPPTIIDEAADHLVNGVNQAAGKLEAMAVSHPGAIHTISEHLRQEDGVQTRRMAATILANALMFHESLAGGPGELANVQSFEQLRGKSGSLNKTDVLAEWRRILSVNYWPIFDIARRILETIPTAESSALIEELATTAEKLLQNRLMRSHDLTGAVFQKLIVDRKFLAAFYTTPASAALLVGLAVTPETLGADWGSADQVKALRIADFACGTGTLLSTAYQRVSQLHELAGGDSEALHPDMMAKALVGCDILPAAAHLTASMLAGAHPAVKYSQSSVLTVAYGRQEDDSIALGSLDLLNPQGRLMDVIAAKALEGTGETEKDIWRDLPHASFDVVIMNPPFTRATNHEGKHADVPNPMFAAFSSSADEQKAMSRATDRLVKGTSAHGNAGEASIFLVLADRKLKPGGTLALVMPLTLLSGSSWEESRTLLYREYNDVIVITIAGENGTEMSFSADTGMGECLVVGRKGKSIEKRGVFVTLNQTPPYPLLGSSTAAQIRHIKSHQDICRLEDGPTGGSLLQFGDDTIGQAIDAPLPSSGGWQLNRIQDFALAQTAYQITTKQQLWLPTMQQTHAHALHITIVGEIGKIGPVHRDINGKNADGSIRGPFDVHDLQPNRIPTYPILWAHDAERERTLTFEADCEGIVYRGASAQEQASIQRKVERVWSTASHCHANLDFQFNSQSTAMQFTTRKTVGGRAWLSVQLTSADLEKALVLWANTSPGLLLRWWHANKQQSGRGVITKESLHSLPVLDVTALTAEQLASAVKLFDTMCQKPLKPIHEIDQDAVRQELDERFLRDVLGLDEAIFEPLA